jgi:hypothetical protein
MDGECSPCTQNSFGRYWFGNQRTLADYEAYAGISFKKRAVQQYTLDNKFAPNPVIEDPVEYENSFLQRFKHCIDLGYDSVPYDDYEFWAVIFEDENGNTINRKDADKEEIQRLKNDPDGYCKIWREYYGPNPHKVIIWPYSAEHGWCTKIERTI